MYDQYTTEFLYLFLPIQSFVRNYNCETILATVQLQMGHVNVRPPTCDREHLEIVLAQTHDLELRQTSQYCAEHLKMVLPKLKMMYFELSLALNMVVFRETHKCGFQI